MTERTVDVKLRMQVAEYLAGARAASAATRDVDKAARDLRKALNEEEDAAGRVRVAEERLTEVRKKGKASASQLAAAEEDLARAHRSHEVATDRVAAANDRYIEAQKKVVEESKKTTKKVDDDMSRMAKRTNAQFDALKFTGLSLGLPAAAAAGVLATTGIVAGAGALFIGLGIAGARGAERVSESWIDTANIVTHGVTELSGVYESHLINASDMVGESFMRSSGLIKKGMVNAADGVESLTASGLNLAENALPGIVTASGRLGPVLDGLHSLTADVGAGFGEMAANASAGADGASEGLVILGDTLRTTEARLGTLSANLANTSSGPLNSFRFILDEVTGSLLDVTSEGSATLGFLGGFTTTTSGAVTVARGLLTVVNALPPQIAQFGGTLTSTSMIAGRFGLDIGKGFEGFSQRIKDAEGASGKFKATMGGLAAGVLNPAALAVGVLSIGLWGLGAAEEKAAKATAEHRENVRTLTDAIRQDKGEISEAAAVANMHALAQKNTADNVKAAGISIAQATVAANGNAVAMRNVTQQSNEWIQVTAQKAGVAQKDIDTAKGMNQLLLEQGGAYSDLNPLLLQSGKSQDQVTESNRAMSNVLGKLGPQQANQLVALLNGTGAVGEQAKATREAYQAYLLQEQGLTDLTEAQIKARDATIEHTKAIYDQQNASLGYRGAVQSTKEALDAWNKVVKDGKQGTDEGTRAMLALENAMSAQELAAYKAAYANSTAKTEQEKVKEATQALNRETVNLANSFTGPLPASLAQTIGKMSVTEARAAGLTVGIDKTGSAVYRLPNGKEIKLTGDNQQALDAIRTVQNELNAVRDKKVTLEMNTTYTYSGTSRGPNAASPTASARFSAEGGLVSKSPIRKLAGGGMVDVRPGGLLRGPGTGTSDSILGWSSRGPVAVSNGEYVTPEKQVTSTTLPILEAIRDGRLQGYAEGGLIGAAREALAQLTSGGQFFEDFSFYGNSANLSAYNEQLAKAYYSATGADFNQGSRGPVAAWLQSYITGQSSVQQAIASGNAVQQVPQFARSYAGGAAAGDGGRFEGNLYLDNGQFLGAVRGEIKRSNRGIRRSVTTGSGGAR